MFTASGFYSLLKKFMSLWNRKAPQVVWGNNEATPCKVPRRPWIRIQLKTILIEQTDPQFDRSKDIKSIPAKKRHK